MFSGRELLAWCSNPTFCYLVVDLRLVLSVMVMPGLSGALYPEEDKTY